MGKKKTKTSLPGGREPAGKNLKTGSIVRLLDLKSEKGKRLNECVAEITSDFNEGRFYVKLLGNLDLDASIGPTGIKIKPMNMRVVCSSCHSDGTDFKICSLCKIACYCDKECQRRHWKKGDHKTHCIGNAKKSDSSYGNGNTNGRGDASPRLIEWDKSMDHPSWANLSQPSRHNLRKIHEIAGCPVAWPVCCETPAMLDCPTPSFLIAHPNMKFKIQLEDMSYLSPTRPSGIAVLTEKVELPFNEYTKKVPQHTPVPISFAIVGEVIWTNLDRIDMEENFKPTQRGALFDWPGAECVGICPGTGKRVPYSSSKKHLLVVCKMQGNVIRGTGLNILTRLMPRILTVEGYHKLIGPDKKDRCLTGLVRMSSWSDDGEQLSESWEDSSMDFYPHQFRIMATSKPQPALPNASMAYELFHTSGEYSLYEKHVEQKDLSSPYKDRH